MPRSKPTTNWWDRTPPVTWWTKSRAISVLWSETVFPWEVDFFPWQFVIEELITNWDNSRYNLFLEDLTWANILDLSWEQVLWISGNEVNKIDTNWN